jgi:hypothetical protein
MNVNTNFKLLPNGVFYQNNESIEIKICDAVEVLAIVSNLDATQWGKLIEFTNAHKQKKNLILPMKLLMNTPRYLVAELSLRGLIISLRWMRLFQEYLCGKNPQKIMVIDYQFSWNHAIFTNFPEAIIVEKVKAFIRQNIKRFYDAEKPDLKEIFHIVGYIKHANEKVYYCIFRRIFEQEITNNCDEMKNLVDKGLLIPRINGDFYHSHKSSSDFCEVYIIESSKI